jgi:cell division protein FtsW (lipid II flippase)
MLYVATERTSWIVFGLLLSAGGAAVVGSAEPHVKVRVQDWLHPLKLAANGGVTETAQSMYAFGSGGLFGSGLGQGYSRLIGGIAPKSDYILATVGEELGLAGLMAVLLLYALLIERGIRTALAARDPFGKLLAIGLSGAFALQVFVVAGGVTGLIPLTGMTMPFLAQGGSSVIANWALVAILLRISDTARRPAPSPAPSPDAEATQVVRSQ